MFQGVKSLRSAQCKNALFAFAELFGECSFPKSLQAANSDDKDVVNEVLSSMLLKSQVFNFVSMVQPYISLLRVNEKKFIAQASNNALVAILTNRGLVSNRLLLQVISFCSDKNSKVSHFLLRLIHVNLFPAFAVRLSRKAQSFLSWC